jgi:serine/threonine protein kinase/Tfp pilus assembly protein PilF
MIGQTILHYKILEKLGEGGMGVVYLAEDTKLKRNVAIKFLPKHIAENTEERKRFEIEAQAAASLNHPNIATIHSIEQTDEHSFLVMEFVEGSTIKKLIEQDAKYFTVKNVIEIAIQVCEGLEAAHEKGIVHRDIKSDNIMLTLKGKIKIMDFGLAKVKGGTKLTEIGSTVGTAAYMSPEQAQGEDVDHRSDIFSLGVVLYEMLTTRLPFDAEHQAALIYSVINENPLPIARYNNKVSPELERIVLKAMAKDKEERYQHVDDMLADLRKERKKIEYAHIGDAGNQSESKIQAAQPNRNKNRTYIIASSVVVAFLILVYFLFFRQTQGISSIAVLPFSITSPDSSAEILSDGITEGVINNLSGIPSLIVMSWSSVSHYKGEHTDIPEIGKKLNVAAVLVGHIIQQGDSYNINVELVDAGNQRHLWGAQYNKQATAMYTLQGELSKAISNQLQIKLTGEEEQRLAKNNTENSEAYTLYLKGLYYLNKRTRASIMKGIDYFNQSLEKDPNYALAYAGIADGYGLMGGNYYMSPNEAYPKEREAAQYALRLDNNLAEAHAALADVLSSYDWNWEGANQEYRKAIELNPNYATAHHWYAMALANHGLFDEAIREIKRAQQLDPLSMRINQNVGYIYYQSRQYDKAIDQMRKTIRIDSTFPYGNAELGDCYFMKRQYDIAYDAYQTEVRVTGDSTNIFLLACVDAVTGRRKEALALYDKLKEISNRKFVATSYFVFIEIYLGNKDKAFKLLERAVEEKDPYMINLKVEPKFDPIRSDPRFANLLKEVHLAQ